MRIYIQAEKYNLRIYRVIMKSNFFFNLQKKMLEIHCIQNEQKNLFLLDYK